MLLTSSPEQPVLLPSHPDPRAQGGGAPTSGVNMTRLSWCFSCVIRWSKYLFSCFLPLRFCLRRQVNSPDTCSTLPYRHSPRVYHPRALRDTSLERVSVAFVRLWELLGSPFPCMDPRGEWTPLCQGAAFGVQVRNGKVNTGVCARTLGTWAQRNTSGWGGFLHPSEIPVEKEGKSLETHSPRPRTGLRGFRVKAGPLIE